MPGLNQLKQFASDIRDLGDEVKIRGKRGEKITEIQLPDTYEEDDSEEFLGSMPERGRGVEEEVEGELTDEFSDDEASSDMDGEDLLDSLGDISDVSDLENESSDAEPFSGETSSSDASDLDFDGMGSMDDLNSFLEESGDLSAPSDDGMDFSIDDIPTESEQSEPLGAVSNDEFAFTGNEINMNEGLPPDIAESDAGSALPKADEAEMVPSMEDVAGPDLSELDDLGGLDVSAESAPSVDEFDPDSINLDAFDDAAPSASTEAVAPADDFDASDIDMSEMESADFSDEKPKNVGTEEFPATEDGFDLFNDFEIEGFTDVETANTGNKKKSVDTVDFSNVPAKPANTLTDEEYVEFKKNLELYPLNLKLELEKFFKGTEFTDETVFEIVEKVLKKTPARQLAGQLEKLTENPISIPRDFERRSYAQYEAYKQSFQYQLKNRIIPGAIVALIALAIGIGLFKASVKFIYKPAMATKYYKQGYALLDNNEFPQSEILFKKAVDYKPIKKWFFNYARGYREKRQYERAAKMYVNILNYFNHDKRGGLEYAEMEAYDRANYVLAEEIVKRHVLDYYVNDPEGIMLLGDIYMEWGETDSEKFEVAKQQYMLLMDLYGVKPLYQARMLRYYICTDKLREVLVYKNIFYPNQKSLESKDWILLSGYLLEKLYGDLPPNEGYLRSSIEDVRGMLEMAIKSDSANPVARYNFAQYFVYNGYIPQAKSEFEIALDLFAKQKKRSKKDTYKEINAARMLGEIYSDGREYLKAQEYFTKGINLFNEEKAKSDFEGDENTGILFADMGNIDYYITGDFDAALENFKTAVNTKYDIPDLHYKIGAINYSRSNYDEALDNFVGIVDKEPEDTNLLLALGNTLSIRGDNFAAQSYYEDLIAQLDKERLKMGLLSPQEKEDEHVLVDMYLKANNNLGVTMYRLAKQTGNSSMYSKALVKLSESNRAWDAMTRNPKSLVRNEGESQSFQNAKFIMQPIPDYEPAIYTEIPRNLNGAKVLN